MARGGIGDEMMRWPALAGKAVLNAFVQKHTSLGIPGERFTGCLDLRHLDGVIVIPDVNLKGLTHSVGLIEIIADLYAMESGGTVGTKTGQR